MDELNIIRISREKDPTITDEKVEKYFANNGEDDFDLFDEDDLDMHKSFDYE